jgi:hypothetical protein
MSRPETYFADTLLSRREMNSFEGVDPRAQGSMQVGFRVLSPRTPIAAFTLTVTVKDALTFRQAPLLGSAALTGEPHSSAPTALTGAAARRVNNAAWVTGLRDKLGSFLGLPPNWNSYGASPISHEATRGAFELAIRLDASDHLEPAVIPTHDGGVQYEWHAGAIDLEVELGPSGVVRYWYDDETTGHEREYATDSLGEAAVELNALLAIIEARAL